MRLGFRADGKITTVDFSVVQDGGGNGGFQDAADAAAALSILYQPSTMRFRGIPVMTNTTPRGPQRGPGQNQISAAVEPLIDKAARRARHRPPRDSPAQCARQRCQDRRGSAQRHERLSAGGPGARRGSCSTGRRSVSAAASATAPRSTASASGRPITTSAAAATTVSCVITPDGKLHLHSGVGNLGTYSYASTTRVAAEVLKMRLGELRRPSRQ